MTQNVDLQVKVKFIVDPKDLQAALSGGGSGGAGGGMPGSSPSGHAGPGAPTAPGQGTGRRGGARVKTPEEMHADHFRQARQAMNLYVPAMQAYNREYQRQLNNLPFSATALRKSKLQMELVTKQIAQSGPELQAAFSELTVGFAEDTLADAKKGVEKGLARLKAKGGGSAARVAAGPKPKVGKGYGSEGMFAAGTSPIMQGLAWQSLFATGDILGPMSFAPMALYQNYSLKRQRRNRGFDLGAGSDLANAAGVGSTGQIESAGHALAAIRRNQALSPEEREKRMAQVDIMSAGRVRGRLGRGIEMFEAGQLGGTATQGLGRLLGTLGGVGAVATGAAAAVAVYVTALDTFGKRAAESVQNIRAVTDAIETAGRTTARSKQLAFEQSMGGEEGADLSVLERAGVTTTFTPRMRGHLASIGRAAGPEKIREVTSASAQAAKLFDTTPEEVAAAIFESGAYRQPKDVMRQRIPNLLGRRFKATGAQREKMRNLWAARGADWTPESAGTMFGDLAESSRADAAYSAGKDVQRGLDYDKNRLAEIARLFAEQEKLGPGAEKHALGSRISSLQQGGMSLTRNVANDPIFMQKQDQLLKDSQAIENHTEQLEKQAQATKNLSDAMTTLTFGLWESRSEALRKELREQTEAKSRWEGAGPTYPRAVGWWGERP